ncbi:MAG: hypothetical protein WC005_04855 [Candidatus Nanopelagicales bacterium]
MRSRARIPIDQAIGRLRVIILLVALLVVVTAKPDAQDFVSVGLIAAALVATNLDRSLIRRGSFILAGTLVVVLDSVLAVLLLGMHDVQPSDPVAMVMVLPLLEAGYRLGMAAMVGIWLAFAVISVAQLAWAPYEGPNQAGATAVLLGLLLLVSLPAAFLSARLVDAAVGYQQAQARAEQRATMLALLVDTDAALAGDQAALLERFVVLAARVLDTRVLCLAAWMNVEGQLESTGSLAVDVVAASFAAPERVAVSSAALHQANSEPGRCVLIPGDEPQLVIAVTGIPGVGGVWAIGASVEDPLAMQGLELLCAVAAPRLASLSLGDLGHARDAK